MTNISKKVLTIDKKRCRVYGCGCISNLEVHHIIPRSQGGPDEEWNLITLCSEHHRLITENKLSDIDVLKKLVRKSDFRWEKALNWHIDRQVLKEGKHESSKTIRNISETNT